MRLCLLDIDSYDEETSVVRMFCKDDKGNSVVCKDKSFEPYLYVLPKSGKEEEVRKALSKLVEVRKAQTVSLTISGERRKIVKACCFHSSDTQKVRDYAKQFEKSRGGSGIVEGEFEYSMPLYRQYLLAKGLSGMGFMEAECIGGDVRSIRPCDSKIAPRVNVMAFHTEAVSGEIVMISMKSEGFEKVLACKEDRRYGRYVEVVRSEKELLQRFVQTVKEREVDILAGFNSDALDMQMIRKRAHELKVRLDISKDGSEIKFARRAMASAAKLVGVVHIDLTEFVRNIMSAQMQTETMTLDAVSAELLNDSKIEADHEALLECWRKSGDLYCLAQYCLKDSDLTLRLANFLLPQMYELSRLSGQPLFDSSRMTYSQLVEWYLSKRAAASSIVIPNQPKWDDVQERRATPKYEGGFVKEPVAGIHENMAVLDFRSLYPSIIASFNISPETFNAGKREDGFGVTGTDYWFCKKSEGFVSSAVKDLIERRAATRERMKSASKEEREMMEKEQSAIKTVANATYGYFGFPGRKWYCRECAESAAALGRFYIGKVIADAEKAGFKVIYADTDSMFLTSDGDTEKLIGSFLKKCNASLPGIMRLNLQGFYPSGIFIPRGAGPGAAKKRYALMDKSGILTIKGLEKVRSDWSAIAKDTQEKVLEMVLGKRDVGGAIKHVQGVISKIRAGKVPLKELALHEQLTRPLSEYKVIGPHISAARKAEERGRPVAEGSMIIYVIVKGKGSISSRAEPIEDVKIGNVDSDYYISNQVVPAALRILAAMGVSQERLLGQGLQRFLGQ